jgi:hypothetical protein
MREGDGRPSSSLASQNSNTPSTSPAVKALHLPQGFLKLLEDLEENFSP